MSRYVAFLRAINVGGHTVRMDALRRLFETWGGVNVETFISSGNVVFEAIDFDLHQLASATLDLYHGAASRKETL